MDRAKGEFFMPDPDALVKEVEAAKAKKEEAESELEAAKAQLEAARQTAQQGLDEADS